MTALTLRLPSEKHQRLKQLAKKRGMTINRLLKGPLIKSHKILQGYRASYPRRTSQGMLIAFTRSATTEMIPCSLALWGLAKNPDSALQSFERHEYSCMTTP